MGNKVVLLCYEDIWVWFPANLISFDWGYFGIKISLTFYWEFNFLIFNSIVRIFMIYTSLSCPHSDSIKNISQFAWFGYMIWMLRLCDHDWKVYSTRKEARTLCLYLPPCHPLGMRPLSSKLEGFMKAARCTQILRYAKLQKLLLILWC